MLNLRELVFSLLSSLTRAQEKADRLACDIAKKYQNDGLLQYLPIPNACFDEVDLHLRFAVVGMDEDSGRILKSGRSAQKATPSESFIRRVAHGIAEKVLDDLGSADKRAAAELSRHIDDVIDDFIEQVRGTSEEETETLVEQTVERIESRVSAAIADNELPLKQSSRASAENSDSIRYGLRSAVSDASALDEIERSIPALNVELEGQGDDSDMQSMRIKLRMRNYRWLSIDDSGQQKLVPEDQG